VTRRRAKGSANQNLPAERPKDLGQAIPRKISTFRLWGK
jgi:hypothetical protein